MIKATNKDSYNSKRSCNIWNDLNLKQLHFIYKTLLRFSLSVLQMAFHHRFLFNICFVLLFIFALGNWKLNIIRIGKIIHDVTHLLLPRNNWKNNYHWKKYSLKPIFYYYFKVLGCKIENSTQPKKYVNIVFVKPKKTNLIDLFSNQL